MSPSESAGSHWEHGAPIVWTGNCAFLCPSERRRGLGGWELSPWLLLFRAQGIGTACA